VCQCQHNPSWPDGGYLCAMQSHLELYSCIVGHYNWHSIEYGIVGPPWGLYPGSWDVLSLNIVLQVHGEFHGNVVHSLGFNLEWAFESAKLLNHRGADAKHLNSPISGYHCILGGKLVLMLPTGHSVVGVIDHVGLLR
jgi:hypothetical protein